MKYSIEDALCFGGRSLCCERPRLSSEILLCSVLGVDRVFLHSHYDKILSDEEISKFHSFLQRANSSEPLEYITNKVSFYSREFIIKSGVLIPRPESEILVDKADEVIKSYSVCRALELGIGSGVISIMLALKNPNLKIIATDINPQAISLSKQNIAKFGVENQIEVVEGDILDGTLDVGRPDFLISNPPYIKNDYPLDKKVLLYEPSTALFGGENGDEILKKIVQFSESRNIKFLACEMGYDQRESLSKELSSFANVEFYKDLSGLDRGFVAKR